MKLLKQVVMRKDAKDHRRLTISLPVGWLHRSNLKRGDLLNAYEVNESTLKIVAEKNPFGAPEEIFSPGRPKKKK